VNHEVNATDSYKYFALVVTRLQTTTTSDCVIGELRLFGTPAPSALEDGHLTLGKALTLPRVSGHPAGAETPRAESLVVHYDTTVDSVVSGSTVVDISGEGNNGTLVNGATYSSTDRALTFDGVNDIILTSSISPSITGQFVHSFSVWLNFTALEGSYDYPIFIGSIGALNQTSILRTSTGSIGPSFGSGYNIFTSFVPNTNQWYHMVVVYRGGAVNGTNVDYYIDGVKKTTTGGSTGTLNIDENTLSLGDNPPGAGNPFKGSISNFKLWNVALTVEEVAQEYALGRTGKSINLTDTALCLGGTVPRSQLDVRGNILYSGNLTSTALPTMWDHMRAGRHGSGIYPIKGKQGGSKVYNVYCEPDIFGGGWMCFTQIPQAGIGIAHNTINLYSFDSGDSNQLRRDKFFNVPYNILSNTNGVDCDILVLLYGAGLRYNMQGAKLGAIWRGVDLTKAFDSTLPNGTTITANAAQATSADGITFTSQSFELISAIGWEISISSASGNTGSYNDYNDGTGGFIIHQNGTSAFSVYGGIRGPAGTWQYGSNTDFKIARIFVRPSQF